MDLATLLRRVKRQFGDEYNIIINDQDIFDWANEAQMQIVRDTTSNDVTVSRAANTFPVGISDRVKIKRVAINNKALSYTTLSELDLTDIDSTSAGNPLYWYYTGGNLHLWPTPNPSDTYNVVVTYSKTPTPLSLVAPYLEWKVNQPSSQLATIAADTDFDTVHLDVRLKLSLASTASHVLLAYKGTSAAAADTAWSITFIGSNTFRLDYSNGTTIRQAPLIFRPATPLIADEIVSIWVTFNAITGEANLYRGNSDGSYTLDDTDTQATSLPFNINTTAGQPVVFGGINTTAVPGGAWKLYTASLNIPIGGAYLYTMEGSTDLASLPTIPATPFMVSTGQTMAVTGGLQVYSEDNTFSVPDVYHDDIVKFCIARAHAKNRDYRGGETMMEEFNQGVTMRRDEANTVDAPTYKGADPFDYGWDWDASYG
jgi:hypothetical protein